MFNVVVQQSVGRQRRALLISMSLYSGLCVLRQTRLCLTSTKRCLTRLKSIQAEPRKCGGCEMCYPKPSGSRHNHTISCDRENDHVTARFF